MGGGGGVSRHGYFLDRYDFWRCVGMKSMTHQIIYFPDILVNLKIRQKLARSACFANTSVYNYTFNIWVLSVTEFCLIGIII